jgi:hypothetical protein
LTIAPLKENNAMMKRFSHIYLFLILLLFPLMSKATHLIGGNIQYRCLGGNDYEINLYLYSDCNAINVPNTAFINANSLSCASNLNFQLNKLSTTDVTAICSSQPSACDGGTGSFGYHLHHYSDTVTITANCADWVLSYSTCCRYGTTNLQNTSAANLYFETLLDNLNISCNSSPVFQSELRLLRCLDQPFQFSFAAYDADGDSLAYSLANPLSTSGSPITYTAGYSPAYPFSAQGTTINFDAQTGEIAFTPDIVQNGYYDVIVEEYRNGMKIGEVRQAAALTVVSCTANNPVVLDEVIHIEPNSQALSLGTNTDFSICSGQTLEFWMRFSDADVGDTVRLDSIETSILEYYPQAILQTYYPHAASGQFDSCWLYVRIPQMNAGIFNLAVSDNKCPIPHIQNFAIWVEDLGTCAQLRGRLQVDLNNNCTAEFNEFGIEGAILKLESSSKTYHAITDANGDYSFSVDPGNYTLSITGPDPIWQANCQNNISINLTNLATPQTQDLQLSPQGNCSALKTDISTPFLQPCTPAVYTVYYQNLGADTAFNAYVEVELDSFLTFLSADLPISIQNGRLYRFDLGNLAPMQKGYFKIETSLSCQADVNDRTHCVKAHIYPDSFCYSHPAWNGVDLTVKGDCDQDSVRFQIHNFGAPMPVKTELIIIEDDIIFLLDSVQLNTNDSAYFAVGTNGSTWRLQTKQGDGHPWSKLPSATLEGCVQTNGSPFSVGFVNQFPEDDGAAFLSYDCQENGILTSGSLLRSYPKGYGSPNYIQQEERLEYHFRFENLSADTLFQMRVRDSLGQNLDISSLRAGTASHPFSWELIEEDILRIWLDSLNIPNRQTDSLAASGFIKFEIKTKPNLSLGTQIPQIGNSYTNYQVANSSNDIFHTIAENFLISPLISIENGREMMNLKVFPNPFEQFFYLELESGLGDDLSFQLVDALGRELPIKSQQMASNQYQLETENLPAGYYLLQVFKEDRLLAVAKLIH